MSLPEIEPNFDVVPRTKPPILPTHDTIIRQIVQARWILDMPSERFCANNALKKRRQDALDSFNKAMETLDNWGFPRSRQGILQKADELLSGLYAQKEERRAARKKKI